VTRPEPSSATRARSPPNRFRSTSACSRHTSRTIHRATIQPGATAITRSKRSTLVLEGELQIKLGDTVETLRRYDAVRIPPQTPRAARNDTDENVVFAMISRRLQDMREETVHHEGFWPAA
jgi:quercetin dioxygenase-like cupin family protein